MKQKQINQNWKKFELGEVGEIITGNTPPRAEKENYASEGTPWIKPPNLNKEKWISKSEEYLSEDGQNKSRMLPRGAVIVSCIGNIGKVAIADCKLSTNQQINSIIPNENVDSEFLFYLIKQIQRRLENLASNAVVPLLNKTGFSKAKIPLPILPDGTPDLKKQKQIVAILEKAEGLKDKGDRLDELFDEYLKSVFNEMFLKEKGKFEEVELSDILDVLTGFAFKSEFFSSEAVDLPLIRIRDLSKGFSNTFYSGKYDEKYLVNKDDLLIGMDGEFRIYEWGPISSLLNQRVCKLTPKKDKILREYLLYGLNLKLKEIEDKTAFVTVKHISSKQIEKIEIPLPPIEFQEKFASIVGQVEKIKDKLKDGKKDASELFNALMQKAFSRELI
jgi:type I restriction enzyme, S subunit